MLHCCGQAVELGLARAQSDYIQTDAAVNSGNSGGPLVNLCGEVVGISSMKAVSADGVSFAIPMDTAKDIINQVCWLRRVMLMDSHCRRGSSAIVLLSPAGFSLCQTENEDHLFVFCFEYGVLHQVLP
jgi:hypothetical protein